MKKRILLLALTAATAIFTLTGCGGSSKKSYEADVNEIIDVNDKLSDFTFDDEDEVEKALDIIDDMKVKTDEGKDIKKDFEDLFELLKDVNNISADTDDDTLDNFDKRYDELEENISKDGNALVDAAKDAGVDDDLIDELTSSINFN